MAQTEEGELLFGLTSAIPSTCFDRSVLHLKEASISHRTMAIARSEEDPARLVGVGIVINTAVIEFWLIKMSVALLAPNSYIVGYQYK